MKPRQDLAEIGSELEGDDALFTALVRGTHAENAAVIAGVSERSLISSSVSSGMKPRRCMPVSIFK